MLCMASDVLFHLDYQRSNFSSFRACFAFREYPKRRKSSQLDPDMIRPVPRQLRPDRSGPHFKLIILSDEDPYAYTL